MSYIIILNHISIIEALFNIKSNIYIINKDKTININMKLIEKALGTEISSVMIEYLTDSEIFLKFSFLNKNFAEVVYQLRGYHKIWRERYL